MQWMIVILALLRLMPAVPAEASVSSEQAAALRTRLTPLGAERTGNAAGTIPPWTGGMTDPPDLRHPPHRGVPAVGL